MVRWLAAAPACELASWRPQGLSGRAGAGTGSPMPSPQCTWRMPSASATTLESSAPAPSAFTCAKLRQNSAHASFADSKPSPVVGHVPKDRFLPMYFFCILPPVSFREGASAWACTEGASSQSVRAQRESAEEWMEDPRAAQVARRWDPRRGAREGGRCRSPPAAALRDPRAAPRPPPCPLLAHRIGYAGYAAVTER